MTIGGQQRVKTFELLVERTRRLREAVGQAITQSTLIESIVLKDFSDAAREWQYRAESLLRTAEKNPEAK